MSLVLDLPAMTGEEVAARVAELAPTFRARAAVTDDERSVPRDTVEDLRGAGVARLLVPREHGGLDLRVRDAVEVTAAAALGCPSTGWLTCLMALVPHTLGLFPREAQDAVWANGPDVVAAGSTGARATRVPRGYRVSGTHPFTSGVNNAEWFYLVGMVVAESSPPEPRLFLLPISAGTVLQTWNTTGMRGTGSNTVITDNVFVPESFTVSHVDAREGTTPGAEANANPRFGLPWVATGAIGFAATMLGATQGAYTELVSSLQTKRLPSGRRTAESEVVLVQVSGAAARISAARTLLLAMADRADSGREYTVLERADVTRDGSFVAHLLVEAIDAIVGLAGTSAFSATSFIQQAWRDVHFAAAHQGLNPRLTGGHYGRLVLDVEEPTPPMFF